ncbi:MAG: ankyrin repeat domain-containing protein [Candidatus Babeliales bacterium]
MKTLNSIFLILMLSVAGTSFGMEPESLIEAVKKNDVKQVQDLLQNGAHVNQLDDLGFSPLYYAAKGRLKEIVALLVAHNADLSELSGQAISTLKQVVEDIIDGKSKSKLAPKSLLTLCCIREYCTDSLLHNDYLPLDMFKNEIKEKAEELISALTCKHVERLFNFFKSNGYEQKEPDFMQKLKEYKNSIK